MGWREELEDEFAATGSGWPGTRAERAMARILDMPAPDRIALARELLKGTGWVPARDIEAEVEAELRGPLSLRDVQALQVGRKIGHNACRAAMLGEEP